MKITTRLTRAFPVREPRIRFLLAMLCSLPLAAGAFARDYYLDPVGGSMSNPGTSDRPWGSLQSVMSANIRFSPGDVLRLRSGYHGVPVVRGLNESPVIIQAAEGAAPKLGSLDVRAARNWIIRGLLISPSAAPSFQRRVIVRMDRDVSGVVLEDCRLESAADSSRWTASDWTSRACDGVSIDGAGNTLRRNTLLNVSHGIMVSGANNLILGNSVVNFLRDGMRGLGNYCVFEGNVVKNCYGVDNHHDDGFQSWSSGPGGVGNGVVKGVVLRGNLFIHYENPAQPFLGGFQGIGCFDGFFEDWIIENNVIIANHWHGISLYGARNCRIVNNTVVDVNTIAPGPPSIRVTAHKNGTPSSGNVVRNNLTSGLTIDAGAATVDHNLKISNYEAFFQDYARRDLRLKPGTAAIDAGSSVGAPAKDLSGLPRSLDGNNDGTAAPDLGAYEYSNQQAPSARPVIASQPQSVTAGAGSRASFSVTASGTGPLSYQWRKNGAAIGGATGSGYTIASAQTGDAGSYDVVVSNSGGSVGSAVAVLTVSASVAANLVNGSFESDYTGWTRGGNLALTSRASDGVRAVSFNSGDTPPNGVLSQAFATTPGRSYVLEFDLGVYSFNKNQQRIQVTAQGTGVLLSRTVSVNGLGGGTVSWTPQSYGFVADSGTTTLTFRDVSLTTVSLDMLLDHVRVRTQGGAGMASVWTPGQDRVSPETAGALSIAALPGGCRIRFANAESGVYQLERSEDLKSWTALTEFEVSGSEVIDFEVADGPAATMFYRIGRVGK